MLKDYRNVLLLIPLEQYFANENSVFHFGVQIGFLLNLNTDFRENNRPFFKQKAKGVKISIKIVTTICDLPQLAFEVTSVL